MWHASVKPYAPDWRLAEELAMQALSNVGQWEHEWQERGNGGVFHIRRRLSAAECKLAGGLTVRDIRGTLEERKRFAMLFSEAPHLRAALRR